MIPVLFVCGPTAVGKTEYSIRLAEDLGGEIVSADSMQIYRFMDIGSAKPPERSRPVSRIIWSTSLTPESPSAWPCTKSSPLTP